MSIAALLENILCYLAFLETNSPKGNFYNKFEAHLLIMPGIVTVVLVLAVIDTIYIFVSWAAICLVNLDMVALVSAVRIPFCVIRGALFFVLVLFGESTKTFSFLASCLVMSNIELWLFCGLYYRAEGKEHDEKPQSTVKFGAAASLGVFILVWCFLFFADAMFFLRSAECEATSNNAMPVRVDGVAEWQCLRWNKPHHIPRLPTTGEKPYEAYCSTDFSVFDTVSDTGVRSRSSSAHVVRCPPSCQTFDLGTVVVGCYIYDAASSICSSAVQAGVLEPDVGGDVVVVGKQPLTSYDRCNLNGIVSANSRLAVAPTNAPSSANAQGSNSSIVAPALDWAFYFQTPTLTHLDMVTLHGWSQKSGLPSKASEPWSLYSANVSWVIGGTPYHREVTLGPRAAAATGDGVEVSFCHKRTDSTEQECVMNVS